MEEYEEVERPLPEVFKELAAAPVRIVTSPITQRFAIRTALLSVVAVLLTGVSISAYLLFYYQYIPALGLTLPVYLQFHPSTYHPSIPQHSNYHHPYSNVQLPRGTLVSGQNYNVKVELCLPRAPQNVDAGNFMVDVELLGPSGSYFPPVNSSETRHAPLVAREARPAVLTYNNVVVSWAKTLLSAPLQVVGLVQDKQCLVVPVMDGVVFDKGWRNQPESARVEIRSAVGLRIYSASITLASSFSGLRWLMYNHRIISFAIFTASFWTVAMGSALAAWLIASTYFASGNTAHRKKATTMLDTSDAETARKTDDDDGDTTDARIKREDEDDLTTGQSTQEQMGAEADDEDEEDDFVIDEPGMPASLVGSGSRTWREDSGLGTSLDRSASSASSVQARRQHVKAEDDL